MSITCPILFQGNLFYKYIPFGCFAISVEWHKRKNKRTKKQNKIRLRLKNKDAHNIGHPSLNQRLMNGMSASFFQWTEKMVTFSFFYELYEKIYRSPHTTHWDLVALKILMKTNHSWENENCGENADSEKNGRSFVQSCRTSGAANDDSTAIELILKENTK